MIFDESNHIERVTIHATDDDDLSDIWINESPVSIKSSVLPSSKGEQSSRADSSHKEHKNDRVQENQLSDNESELTELESIADSAEKEAKKLNHAPKDFERGPWLDPSNTSFR